MVVRVMQINSGQKFAGVSSMILNFYKNVDRSKVQFDFVAPQTSSFAIYKDEIEKMGGNIIELQTCGNFVHRKTQFFKRLARLIKKRKYDVVHVNSGSIFLNIQVSWIAHYCGVKKIIVHSHNAGNDKKSMIFLTKLCKPLLEFGPTDYFACSNLAAKFMFTKKRIQNKNYTVINNAVDVEKFRFNMEDRDSYRKDLSIENKTVLLHVGRFAVAKNHKKLIQIFSEYQKINSQSVLLLAGEGELKKQVQQEVKDLNLSESVIFLGLRKDIPQLMSVSDIFILPSLFEGLPVVGVEAQTNGLPCLFSSSITREVNLNVKKNKFIKTGCTNKRWASIIDNLSNNFDQNNRNEAYRLIINHGYLLKDVGKKLENIYLSNKRNEEI